MTARCRDLSVVFLFGLALVLLAPGAPRAASVPGDTVTIAQAATTAGSAAFNWKSQTGKSIRAIVIQGPWIDAVRNQVPKFERETGLKVTLEVYPESQAWDKIRVELQARNPDLDVFFNQPTRFGTEFTTNSWYEPLERYLQSAALTAADFDFPKDFPSSTIDAVTFGGKAVAIPTDRDLGRLLFYRKDLLEQHKIAVPKTFAELEAAAKQIHRSTSGKVAGIVNRGKGATATSQFSSVLSEFGGRWEDDRGNPTVNSPEAIAAFDWWGRTLRESGPPGTATFDFAETVNEFLSGKAAFSLEAAINPGVVNNPQKSQVVGKVGYVLIPGGPGGPKVRQNQPCKVSRMFGMSLSAFSKNKEAGWLFVQWMTGKAAQLDYQLAGRLAARNSAWAHPEFAAKTKQDKEYWEAMDRATHICYATPGFAPDSIKDQGRARDTIGQIIVASILGRDVKAAADQAQQELVALKARQ
jgi:multiple sugar transport system substrate-binding protein